MAYAVLLLVLFAVALVVSAPLWRPAQTGDTGSGPSSASAADALVDLEAAREAKYREIRDAELDHETGKLSDADFAAIDRTLRAEAAEILHELDTARERVQQPTDDGGDAE